LKLLPLRLLQPK
jgi:hypothetical protein